MNIHRRSYIATGLNVIFADEIGQLIAKEFASYDIILRHVRRSTTRMGGMLIIGTLDHLQMQPIHERPFLTRASIIPYIQNVRFVILFVTLETSALKYNH